MYIHGVRKNCLHIQNHFHVCSHSSSFFVSLKSESMVCLHCIKYARIRVFTDPHSPVFWYILCTFAFYMHAYCVI